MSTSKTRTTDAFHFQQFSVSQDRCAMKVGTDGVLLGAWASLPKALEQPVKVVDVGTGTGLISLMIAQRLAHAGQAFAITALEPEPQAAAQARENAARSPWDRQIQVCTQAIATAPLSLSDLWVCNPPFFDQKQTSSQPERAQARHSEPEFIPHFFERASDYLAPRGRIALVLPGDRAEAYLDVAQRWGWHWQKRCWVRHSAQHPVKRVLLELARAAFVHEPHTQTLCLKEAGPKGWQDSTAYAQWVSPFYLRYQESAPAQHKQAAATALS